MRPSGDASNLCHPTTKVVPRRANDRDRGRPNEEVIVDKHNPSRTGNGTAPKSEVPERGYCQCGCGEWAGFWHQTHRARGRIKGQPKAYVQGHRPLPALPERILERTDFRGGSNGCWNWTGAISRGYGSLKVGGRVFLAYQAVYELLVGPVPRGLVIDHLCRNTRCVNPGHLEPVVTGENTRRGSAAKLDWEKVERIRSRTSRGEPYLSLAVDMGVTPSTIGRVARGESWPESERPGVAGA